MVNRLVIMIPFLFLGAGAIHQHGESSNFVLPVREIERRLQFEDLTIFRFKEARFTNDLVKRVILQWSDGVYTQAKWKRAPRDGHVVNNAPRYELAAYELQKLFLDADDYVVPPTVIRTYPLSKYREIEESTQEIEPTFDDTEHVFFVLQYWLENVTTDEVESKKRFEDDTTYARNLANMNLFSYLIHHNDSNIGNFLISKDSVGARVFAVDNGMAFGSRESQRGQKWREIRVPRLPRRSVEHIRKIELQALHSTLGVIAQFERAEGEMKIMQPTENIGPSAGVRISETVIQFGLTEKEIEDIFERLQRLIKRIDEGKFELF